MWAPLPDMDQQGVLVLERGIGGRDLVEEVEKTPVGLLPGYSRLVPTPRLGRRGGGLSSEIEGPPGTGDEGIEKMHGKRKAEEPP